jgi:hypothetical protein
MKIAVRLDRLVDGRKASGRATSVKCCRITDWTFNPSRRVSMGGPISPIGEARRQKELALARIRQLQANVLEGKLLSAADVRACWVTAMASQRERAMGMADQIATRGAHRR